jgi:cell division transport system permease protein
LTRQAARNARRPAPARSKGATPRHARLPWRHRVAAWCDQHVHAFFSSLERLVAKPWATTLTLLVLGFALALPLLFFLVLNNARELSGGLREAREITAFLKPEQNAKTAATLADELRTRTDVASVLLRTPEQGLAEFRQLSGFGEALDSLQSNPLPSVLVVTPRAIADADNPALIGDLKSDPRVDFVQYDAAWRHKLTDILHLGERIVVVIAALLALAALLVIGNTVRMDIQSRSEEISIMQMIGASNGFVRRPFLYSGLCYGLLGSLFALLIALAVELALAEPIGRLIDSYAYRLSLRGVDAAVAFVLIGAGAVLGWLGAFFATSRHLAAGKPQA